MKRLIIGISGASGAIYGVRMLQVLRDVPDIETHLILSQAARQTLAMETDFTVREVQALADVVHDARDCMPGRGSSAAPMRCRSGRRLTTKRPGCARYSVHKRE